MDDPKRLMELAAAAFDPPDRLDDVRTRLGRRQHGRRLFAAAAALVIAGAGVAFAATEFSHRSPPPAHHPLPHPSTVRNGSIFFSAGEAAQSGYDEDIWSVEPTTGKVRHVVHGTGVDVEPAVSPDGRRLAFVRSIPRQGSDIYVSNADGSGLRRLTRCCLDYSPVWSPDGRRIAFLRGLHFNFSLMVMNANGSSVRVVCSSQRCGSFIAEPAWSPDGTRIAFSHIEALSADGMVRPPSRIDVVSADGSGSVPLNDSRCTTAAAPGCRIDRTPQWLPDGQHLVFGRDLLNPPGYGDSGGVLQEAAVPTVPSFVGAADVLATCPACNVSIQPRVSPDGRSVLFVSAVKPPGKVERSGITVVDVASHTSRFLDPCGGRRCLRVEEAVWSPDGRQIAFIGLTREVLPSPLPGQPPPPTSAIFVMNANGSGLRQVAVGSLIGGIQWQPLR